MLSLVGWLVTAAAMARLRHRTLLRRIAAGAVATYGAVASVPASLLNLIACAVADSDARAAPPWTGYIFVVARPAAVVGVLLMAGAWLLSTTFFRRS